MVIIQHGERIRIDGGRGSYLDGDQPRVDGGVCATDHRRDVGVTAGGRRDTPFAGEGLCFAVCTAGQQPGVVHLDGVGPGQVVPVDVVHHSVTGRPEGMGNDGDATGCTDPVESLPKGQSCGDEFFDPDGENVSGGTRYLDAGNADQSVLRRQVGRLQARSDGVVVRDRHRVQAHLRGPGQERLDRVAAVVRERGVTMQLDGKHTVDLARRD
jgi:hypothetical protein